MRIKNKKETTFRFPFDIDTRYFLVLAFIFFILSIRQANEAVFPKVTISNLKEKISRNTESSIDQFELLLKDSVLLQQLYSKKVDEGYFDKLEALPFSVFFYQSNKLVFWNKIETATPRDTFLVDRPIPYKDSSGYYILFKKVFGDASKQQSGIAMMKIKNDYGIENHFFTKNFLVGDAENDFNLDLSFLPKSNSAPIIVRDVPQFYLYKNEDFLTVNDKNGWRLFFSALPFIFFGISIHTYFKVEIKKKNIQLIYGLLLLTILMVRLASFLWGFPNDYSEYSLFSPEFFASDDLNRSLGDLFINVCLVFWALLFFIINVQGKVYDLKRIKYKSIIGVTVFSITISLAFYLSDLVYRIIRDSIIHFDTTQFYQLDLFSFIGLLSFMVIFVNILCLSIISHFYLTETFSNRYIKYLLVILAYILYKVFIDSTENQVCYFYLFLSFTGLYMMLDLNYLKIKFDFNSYKLLFWLITISFAGAFYLMKLIDGKEISNRTAYAQKLLSKNDDEMLTSLKAKVVEMESDRKLDSLVRVPVIGLEATRAYLNSTYFSFGHLIQEIKSIKNCTDTPRHDGKLEQIIAFERSNEKGFKIHLNLLSSDLKPNCLEIELMNRSDNSNNQYADLLISNNSKDLLASDSYSMAIYEHKTLSWQVGSHVFPYKQINNLIHYDSTGTYFTEHGGYDELWLRNEDKSKEVVIVNIDNKLYLFTTLFAYLFFIYFVTISLYILGNIIARSNLNYKRFLTLMSLNLRLRIHLSILIVELCSFIVIGYSTSYFLIRRVNDKNRQNIINYSYLIQNEIKNNAFSQDDSLLSKGLSSVDPTIQFLHEIAGKYSLILNFYDQHNGQLIFSSSPELFKKQVISEWVSPSIFNKLQNGLFDNNIHEEKLGMLKYLSSYSFLRNTKGENLGILQVPFFLTNSEIRSENTAILTTLINIYIFVFLFSAIIAFFLTKSVTRPFSYIVKQFTKINLAKTNEPLKWFDSDEIGLLIKEYNRMLRKLENSTVLLAKTEREMAWREMAKQVAHEIKNPLTPMKLSLQMLERAIKNNAANVNEIAIKVTKTLVEQIDNLSLIATDFSNFAKLPVSRKEVFNLNEFLYSVTGMYHDDHDNEFLFIIPDYEIQLFADKSQIMRVFTNIIQNAIQAIPEDRKGNIALTTSKIKNNFVRISISDNGEGISAEKASNLFQPYFTTKTSGTGLGLAMCKDILEESGGKISFESIVGEGTIFHLDLPIYLAEV